MLSIYYGETMDSKYVIVIQAYNLKSMRKLDKKYSDLGA